jgi:Asp-tRNA(Asn)/Glu-tRNA(Gln) amidotransferase A subunit family amidase
VGSISAETIMNLAIENIHKLNPEVNAIISMHSEEILMEMARQADVRIQKGERKGPLDGIPMAVKDNLVTSDLATTCASNMLKRMISN